MGRWCATSEICWSVDVGLWTHHTQDTYKHTHSKHTPHTLSLSFSLSLSLKHTHTGVLPAAKAAIRQAIKDKVLTIQSRLRVEVEVCPYTRPSVSLRGCTRFQVPCVSAKKALYICTRTLSTELYSHKSVPTKLLYTFVYLLVCACCFAGALRICRIVLCICKRALYFCQKALYIKKRVWRILKRVRRKRIIW